MKKKVIKLKDKPLMIRIEISRKNIHIGEIIILENEFIEMRYYAISKKCHDLMDLALAKFAFSREKN